MNEKELKNIWQSSSKKLEQSLHITEKNTGEITKLKVDNVLSSMKPVKIIAIAIGVLWVILVDRLIINEWNSASSFFLISAAIQVLLTKLAIGIYLYQLYLIRNVDLSEPILSSQERLSRLKFSTLWVTRILFLQLPVWTTFYWHTGMFSENNILFSAIQAAISILSVYAAVWLFLNIKFENRDKKWFRLIFNGKEWDPIMKSMELIQQIDEFKTEIT